MSARPVRVLVVDDSAFSRQVLKDALAGHGIEVVGTARDGHEALELLEALRPDVVTLDLVMPRLDGIGFLRAAPAVAPCRVVVVSSSSAENGLVLEALQLGAVDFVRKSTRGPGGILDELSADLAAKVLAAAAAHAPPRAPPAAPPPAPSPVRAPRRGPRQAELVVVGASTGGPQALGALLPALPATLSCPVAIALHMPVEYTASLAARLDGMSGVRVREARDGMPLVPGEVVLGRGGLHLVVERGRTGLVARLSPFPARLHVPSVDVLFESAAAACGRAAVGVVLTGMGDDGARGAAALRRAGAPVLTEAESTAVIYGMPRAVEEAKLSTRAVPLDEMASAIQAQL